MTILDYQSSNSLRPLHRPRLASIACLLMAVACVLPWILPLFLWIPRGQIYLSTPFSLSFNFYMSVYWISACGSAILMSIGALGLAWADVTRWRTPNAFPWPRRLIPVIVLFYTAITYVIALKIYPVLVAPSPTTSPAGTAYSTAMAPLLPLQSIITLARSLTYVLAFVYAIQVAKAMRNSLIGIFAGTLFAASFVFGMIFIPLRLAESWWKFSTPISIWQALSIINLVLALLLAVFFLTAGLRLALTATRQPPGI
ncbi:MAG: hypothetical protein FWD61_18495 [Phycisphaerales bacterium]|nr:hypothetical protein [Phycisphaerales bacterium]